MSCPLLVSAADAWSCAMCQIAPPVEWPERLRSAFMSIAPKGLSQVMTLMCGSCANEVAFKAVFMAHAHRTRNGAPFSAEELASCMRNKPPGSPDLSIVSFDGG